MKIIDMRVLPPYGQMINSSLFRNYNCPASRAFRSCLGLHDDPAAINLSMTDFMNEMDAMEIETAVVIERRGEQSDLEDPVKLMHEFPGRFRALLHIEAADGPGALNEIERHVVFGDYTGIYLEPGYRLAKIIMHGDDPRIFPIYDLCSGKNIPVVLQYGGGVNSTEFYTPADIDRIVAAFPDLKLAIAHGGWPQVMPFCHLAYRHKNVFLLTDCYLTGYPGSGDYVIGANGILQDKIMFGSCYPGYSLGDAVQNYLHAGLDEKVLPKVMRDNAARFLGFANVEEVVLPDAHTGFDARQPCGSGQLA